MTHADPRAEAQIGLSYMDGYSSPSVFFEYVGQEHSIDNGSADIAPDFSLGWIRGRNVARYANRQYNTLDDIVLGAIGLRLCRGAEDSRWHSFFLSEQVALQTGRTRALSSSYEFVTTLGWQGDRVSLLLRHISNGGTSGANRGETMAMIGIGTNL
jgi:hypothetical protein